MLCLHQPSYYLPKPSRPYSTTVDISFLLKPRDDEESHSSASPASAIRPSSALSDTAATTTAPSFASTVSTVPSKRHSAFGVHPSEPPAKKQSKWSADEDSKIIHLRGEGMKWEDISKHLPGRSAISCRLHYQNYLERRSEWDEDRKNKLARLYERFKAEMWSKIAEEMTIPWRAAEAMHWQMGEQDMARRAGVTPFSLTNNVGLPMVAITPRSHIRHSSAAPRLRPDSASRLVPPQLPSLAEFTRGLPAYANSSHPGTPYPQRRSPPHLYHPSDPPWRQM